MAPLVPEYISAELNLILAFVIGMGFGFILEQAGFSSTKKLAGLFYGYDFTVLKVFFTAGITAMLGVLLLGQLGLLDLSIIYVNPTFLWSAIVGGLIMGLGFIIGGFCPGTSVCALAIGKIDAFAFVFGSLLGVLIFAEAYPWLEGLYLAEAWGPVLVYEALGTDATTFALLLTLVALTAFAITARIQDKVNHIRRRYQFRMVVRALVFGSLPILLASFLFVVPTPEERMRAQLAQEDYLENYDYAHITADKLAWELLYKTGEVLLVDVRSPKAYKASHLPLSVNVPLDSLFQPQWRALLEKKVKKRVFYGDDEAQALRALIIAEQWLEDGRQNLSLEGGQATFETLIMQPTEPETTANKIVRDRYRFAQKASKVLKEMEVQRSAAPAKPVKVKRRIQGGCS